MGWHFSHIQFVFYPAVSGIVYIPIKSGALAAAGVPDASALVWEEALSFASPDICYRVAPPVLQKYGTPFRRSCQLYLHCWFILCCYLPRGTTRVCNIYIFICIYFMFCFVTAVMTTYACGSLLASEGGGFR